MINVSDHHTRTRANAASGAAVPAVMGCLLGSQSGRIVDISNTFELDYTMQEGKVVINEAFLARKQEQCEWATAGVGTSRLPVVWLPGIHSASSQVPLSPQPLLPTATTDKQVFPKVDVLGWYATGAAV